MTIGFRVKTDQELSAEFRVLTDKQLIETGKMPKDFAKPRLGQGPDANWLRQLEIARAEWSGDTRPRSSGPADVLVRAKYRDISIGARYREAENQGLMQGANKDKWLQLCAQAAVEQNPRRLLELTRQINELLSGKQHRLDSQATMQNDK